jgi:hypothetical protein
MHGSTQQFVVPARAIKAKMVLKTTIEPRRIVYLASQTSTLQPSSPSIIHFKLQLPINDFFFQSIWLALLEGNKGCSGAVFSTHSMRLTALPLSDQNACRGATVSL